MGYLGPSYQLAKIHASFQLIVLAWRYDRSSKAHPNWTFYVVVYAMDVVMDSGIRLEFMFAYVVFVLMYKDGGTMMLGSFLCGLFKLIHIYIYNTIDGCE